MRNDVLIFDTGSRRTLTCTSCHQSETEKQTERNVKSLTCEEQMRTNCRNTTRKGPLTLVAPAMLSLWAGKLKLSSFLWNLLGRGSPWWKLLQLNRLERSSHTEAGPTAIRSSCLFIQRLVTGRRVFRGHHREGPLCRHHQQEASMFFLLPFEMETYTWMSKAEKKNVFFLKRKH